MARVISSGLLNYRFTDKGIEVLLGKVGGPIWACKERSWGIPKGCQEEGEALFETAKREFKEETSLEIPDGVDFMNLESIKINKKTVYAWAYEYDYGNDVKFVSNKCIIEYPKGSGNQIEINEIDEGKYFPIDDALNIVILYQMVFLERLRWGIK